MGKVVEFPRKLEWQQLESWMGRVPNTNLITKVESQIVEGAFSWYAWNGTFLLAMGTAGSLEEGKEAAKAALEQGALVARTL
jgi:hypothetical protein